MFGNVWRCLCYTWGWGCYWQQVGWGQGCYWNNLHCTGQHSPPPAKRIQPQYLGVEIEQPWFKHTLWDSIICVTLYSDGHWYHIFFCEIFKFRKPEGELFGFQGSQSSVPYKGFHQQTRNPLSESSMCGMLWLITLLILSLPTFVSFHTWPWPLSLDFCIFTVHWNFLNERKIKRKEGERAGREKEE